MRFCNHGLHGGICQRGVSPLARGVVCLAFLGVAAAAYAQESMGESMGEARGERSAQEPSARHPEVFATVGDTVITVADYRAEVQRAVRQRYYHGHPPEGELVKFQREVANAMIDRVLLLKEAKRRGLRPDEARVKAELERYEQRYSQSPQWRQNRADVLPVLQRRLEEDDLLRQVEDAVREAQRPTEQQLKAYYRAHRDKFTEPQQVRVSLILLKVEPSSPEAVWAEARAEAARLVQRLRKGADFAELARLHSGDGSAQNGGDLGYLHKGMLGEPAQEAIDKLRVGELSEPITLLEGVAIFLLRNRKAPYLNPFEQAKDRARELWIRDEAQRAHQAVIKRLRAETRIQIPVQIREQYLPSTGGKGRP